MALKNKVVFDETSANQTTLFKDVVAHCFFDLIMYLYNMNVFIGFFYDLLMVEYVRAALQEHLGTLSYKGSADRVLDLAVRRLGERGVFSVVSIGDERLANDKRYERFVDSIDNSSKYYIALNYAGRAIEVRALDKEDTGLIVYNGIELEFGANTDSGGSLLVYGLERDTQLQAGPDVSLDDMLRQLEKEPCPIVVPHPFFRGGLGPFLDRLSGEELSKYLDRFHGFEV